MHRSPTVNDIFLRLRNACYLTLLDSSTIYHNLNLDKISSYLIICVCHFGQYMYARPATTGDMFQHKTHETFKVLSYVFGIADYILFVGYVNSDKDNNRMLRPVIQICHKEGKCHLGHLWVLFFGNIIFRHNVQLDPYKLHMLTTMPLPTNKTELQSL